MSDTGKSREELVAELSALRERVEELESREKNPVQYEHRLDEIVESLQKFCEAAFEALFLTEDGICLGQSCAAGELFGCPAEEAIGKPVADWVIPEDRGIVTQNLLSGSEETREVTALRRDGSAFPAEIRARSIRFERHVFYVVALHDISPLRLAEQELTRTQSLLTSVIEQAPIPIIIARPDGIVEMVNHASREQLGVLDEPQTGVGVNLFDFEKTWTDCDAAGNPIPIEELPLALSLQGKTTRRREMRVVRKDGSERWELVDGVPVYDAAGKLIAGVIMFPDITDLKQAGEQLRTSHRHLAALMENSSDYILISDETAAPVVFNDAYKQVIKDLLGIEMEPGLKPHTLVDDESTVAFWEGLHRRVLGGESFRAEFSYPLLTGELRHFELSFTPIVEDGEVKGFSEISRDITSRRLREEMLKDSETRFRAIFENSVDAIAVARNAIHIAVNAAYLAMYGYDDVSELVGKPVLDLIAPSERERVAEKIRRHAADGTVTPAYETVGVRRDGAEFDVDVHVSTYTLGGNTYSVVFLRDITKRKRAEKALQESEQRLSNIVAALPLGMHLYRLEPDGRLIFTGNNPAADRILGVENRQFVGKTIEEAFPPLADTGVPDRYRRAASEGEPWFAGQIDFEYGGISGVYEVHAFQITPGQMGALFRDITARRQAELELERYREHLEDLVAARTAELEAANRQLLALSRVKDEFISNVSHELRSPITSLKVNLHALGLRPEKRDAYTMSLQRELARLENLVENLLTVSRLDQGRVEFTFAPVDLNDLLEVYVNDRRAVADQQNLTLAVRKSSGLPPVNADRSQLDQVVSILLTNALNYTQAGGTVTISTRVDSREGREYVCFSVGDTGPGISPEDRAQLFERFFRGKAGRDSGAPGTGLGLSIAREIVDRHDGLIEVVSEGLGRGAVFTVWLPAGEGDVG